MCRSHWAGSRRSYSGHTLKGAYETKSGAITEVQRLEDQLSKRPPIGLRVDIYEFADGAFYVPTCRKNSVNINEVENPHNFNLEKLLGKNHKTDD